MAEKPLLWQALTGSSVGVVLLAHRVNRSRAKRGGRSRAPVRLCQSEDFLAICGLATLAN